MTNKSSSIIKDFSIETVGLKIRQSSVERDLYVFTVDGKTIAEQVGVRRMKWHSAKYQAEGFQRPLQPMYGPGVQTQLGQNALPSAI